MILSGGSSLPSELHVLKAAIEAMSEQQSAMSSAAGTGTGISSVSTPSVPPPALAKAPANGVQGAYVRSNIFDNSDLDISRLRIKEDMDEPQPLALAPGVGKEVSDEMRARIMRLVERQRVEAEEQARAVAEARGEVYRPDRGEEYNFGEEDDMGTDGEVGPGGGRTAGARVNEGDGSGDEEEVGENVVEVSEKLFAGYLELEALI